MSRKNERLHKHPQSVNGYSHRQLSRSFPFLPDSQLVTKAPHCSTSPGFRRNHRGDPCYAFPGLYSHHPCKQRIQVSPGGGNFQWDTLYKRMKNRPAQDKARALSIVSSCCCSSTLVVDRMLWLCLTALAATAAAQSSYDLDGRVPYPGKSSSLGPLYGGQGFRDNSYEDNIVTPTPTPAYRPPGSQQALYRKPDQGAIRVNGPPRGILRGGQNPQAEAEELEEKEEPDRLTLLLPQSKFDCVNKQTGYYADEDLNCEVFHYCQDNAKHSWICPEGFTFHQVHLICMPPSGDISCKKSSQYHFVNEYLYKPLNQQEVETKPNVTLRYSERYFPADIHADERETGDYQITPSAPIRRPSQPIYASSQPALNSIPASARPQSQGLPQFRLPLNQVFRSPEEVNIPLQQRRPQPHHQPQPVRRYPQVRPDDEEYE
ncbi:uncharacterized protein LOC144469407 isoform X2 [Augochlora pura]